MPKVPFGPTYDEMLNPSHIDPEIRKNCQEIMSLCDEVTVTCPFMKQYYMEKTGHKHVTIIPNFPPKNIVLKACFGFIKSIVVCVNGILSNGKPYQLLI